jgi:DDE superfamily endonuclease
VPISGQNAKRVVYGTLNLQTGNRLLWALQGHRAVDFQEFLEVLHWYYRGWHIVMVLDQDSSYTAAGSESLARRLNIELLPLPKRSPHLNPMDHLRRHGKEVICANWGVRGPGPIEPKDRLVQVSHFFQGMGNCEKSRPRCCGGVS